MAGFPTGVAIVAAFDTGGRPWGMTCTSLCSVALRPPTLLVCLRAGSPTLRAVVGSGGFSVNLLAHHARAAAALFASGAPDRFDRVHWRCPRPGASPHLDHDAHAIAECQVSRHHEVGDHVVVFGEVTTTTVRPAFAPLLYGQRQYAPWPG
jgi:flavin reductase (NADH)